MPADSMAYDKQLEYWQKVLEGAPALTGAPTDRQRPSSVNPERYASVKQHLSAAPQDQLRQFASDGGEATVLAAVWQVRTPDPCSWCPTHYILRYSAVQEPRLRSHTACSLNAWRF